MVRSSRYSACRCAAARNSSTVTWAGPAVAWPIGLSAGVFVAIIRTAKVLAAAGTDTWPCTSSTGRSWYIKPDSSSFPVGECHSGAGTGGRPVSGYVVDDAGAQLLQRARCGDPVEDLRGPRAKVLARDRAQRPRVAADEGVQ